MKCAAAKQECGTEERAHEEAQDRNKERKRARRGERSVQQNQRGVCAGEDVTATHVFWKVSKKFSSASSKRFSGLYLP
jgi:hypothetical protein